MALPKYVELPKIPGTRKYDIKLIKQQYLDSIHMNWKDFADDYGYNPEPKTKLKFRNWREEKKQLIEQQAIEREEKELLSYENKYNSEVLETLTEMPKTVNLLHATIRLYAKRYHEELQEYIKSNPNAGQTRLHKEFPAANLKLLVDATESIITSKHRSLLLDRWDMNKTKERIYKDKAEEEKDKNSPKRIQFKVITPSGTEVSDDEFAKQIASYYDRPYDETIEIEQRSLEQQEQKHGEE